MAGKVLELTDIITPDQVGDEIARMWHTWDIGRREKKDEWVELRKYIYATDTRQTSNSKLPWSNSTTIPKLCQIRDNLFSNYVASMFPKRRWLKWEGTSQGDEAQNKVNAIKDYMMWVVSQKEFRDEVHKLIYDYIDYGNVFATVEWVDESTNVDGEIKPAYVGPRIKRISPLDIVMNPISPSFKNSPKIIRSLMTMGEAKLYLEQLTATPDQKEVAKEVWKYLLDVRERSQTYGGEFKEVDEYLQVDGFQNYTYYLGSNYVELLTFYGDWYDRQNDKLYKNRMVVVADRHKVIYNEPHSINTGNIPLYHSGWRVRQDNLWAMGPLDNLVGMQYRIDHVENLKADLFDLTVFPPIKIRGEVEDFEWGPFERIHVDSDGDVELMSPKVDIMTANLEITAYEQRMEEMAGAPKEAMGFRTPGEKTMYEVQRLENAASRVFQSKISQFEEQVIEPLLNAMLAEARENLTSETIRVIEDEFKTVAFKNITKTDLSAMGTLKPVAARHFAENAELVQNITNFFQGPLGADPEIKTHFSTIKLAKMFEEILGIEDYEVVQEYVRLSEQADAQSQSMAMEEQTMMTQGTPSGLTPEDF
jgi:hypothetical protein